MTIEILAWKMQRYCNLMQVLLGSHLWKYFQILGIFARLIMRQWNIASKVIYNCEKNTERIWHKWFSTRNSKWSPLGYWKKIRVWWVRLFKTFDVLSASKTSEENVRREVQDPLAKWGQEWRVWDKHALSWCNFEFIYRAVHHNTMRGKGGDAF